MTTIVVSTGAPYGHMTNQVTGRLRGINADLARLQDAVSTASSGYTGVEGTEFETMLPGANVYPSQNLFSVMPDSANPGAQGTAYRYALGQLATAWLAFWKDAEPYVAQLDNGTS